MVVCILRHPAEALWIATGILGGISLIAERMDRWEGSAWPPPASVNAVISAKSPFDREKEEDVKY